MIETFRCGHPECQRRAVKVVGMVDTPNRLGHTHDCCSLHCKRNIRDDKEQA